MLRPSMTPKLHHLARNPSSILRRICGHGCQDRLEFDSFCNSACGVADTGMVDVDVGISILLATPSFSSDRRSDDVITS